MALVALSLPLTRGADVRIGITIVGVAGVCLLALAPSLGLGNALLYAACLLVPVAWIALVARARTVLLDTERKKIVVRWRTAFFVRREVELSLERFAAVVSYNPLGSPPANCVALLERAAGRALVIAGFPAEYRGRGFRSLPRLVEAERATQLRAALSKQTGLPDGGYKGLLVGLRRSEKAVSPHEFALPEER